jgi:hypothetical protein
VNLNWDALGVVVEAVGAIGVIVSVFYLAIQIRKQTTEAQLAATRDLARFNNEIAESISSDRELLKVYLKGASDYDSLSDEDRLVFGFFISRGMRLQEQIFLHSTHENLHASFYESIRARLTEQLALSGVRRWWELNKNAFSSDFRRYIAAELGEEDHSQHH